MKFAGDFFHPGDDVIGRLTLECNDTLRFKCLSVTLIGVMKTWAKENKSGFLKYTRSARVSEEITFVNDRK